MNQDAIRVGLDLTAAATLGMLAVKARGRLKALPALGAVLGGVIAPLVAALSVTAAGYRPAIAFDLAYVAIVVVYSLRTRGEVWRVVPRENWTEETAASSIQQFHPGLIDLAAVFAIWAPLQQLFDVPLF